MAALGCRQSGGNGRGTAEHHDARHVTGDATGCLRIPERDASAAQPGRYPGIEYDIPCTSGRADREALTRLDCRGTVTVRIMARPAAHGCFLEALRLLQGLNQ